MDIRQLTESYAVSAQITPADIEAITSQGYATLIDNRPDGEVPADLQTSAIRAAAEAAGLSFIANPVIGGALTEQNVTAQRAAMEASDGKVLAYCASGNRSCVVWALAMAGRMPTDALIDAGARYGYQLEGLRGQIDLIATRN